MKKFLRRRGQAAVEFALLLPVFALVLFSIIYTGFFVLDYVTLNNAAAQAARAAALNKSSSYSIPDDVRTKVGQTPLFLSWYAIDAGSPKRIINTVTETTTVENQETGQPTETTTTKQESVTVMIQTNLTMDERSILAGILPEHYTVSKTANIEE